MEFRSNDFSPYLEEDELVNPSIRSVAEFLVRVCAEGLQSMNRPEDGVGTFH